MELQPFEQNPIRTPAMAWPTREPGAIIFDCDGTLTNSMPIHYIAWYQTMKRHGIEFPEDRFYALGGMPSGRIIHLLSREQGVLVDAAALAEEKENAFLAMVHKLEPIESVLQIARYYRHRIPLAVASGGIRTVIVQQLKQLEILDWFDTVVTAEDTTRHKPEPDVFLEAARRMQVAPSQCLVYEDADLGVEAAKAANMQCIDVRHFYSACPSSFNR